MLMQHRLLMILLICQEPEKAFFKTQKSKEVRFYILIDTCE
jgi:hypothetical protein